MKILLSNGIGRRSNLHLFSKTLWGLVVFEGFLEETVKAARGAEQFASFAKQNKHAVVIVSRKSGETNLETS